MQLSSGVSTEAAVLLDSVLPRCCDVVIGVKIVLLMKGFKLVYIMKPCLKYCKIVLFLFVVLCT
jgi:hypothetical protein